MNKHNTVFFDLDDTIIKGDSIAKFMIFYLKRNPSKIFVYISLIPYFILFMLKIVKNKTIKGRIAKIFKHETLDNLSKIGLEFVNTVVIKYCYSEALEEIKKCKENGYKLILITASFEFYAIHIANKLGFDKCIATKLWTSDNIYTGQIYGRNCYGVEKKSRLHMEGYIHGQESNIAAYSDSISDLPLFEFAKERVCVNPKRSLSKYAMKYKSENYIIVDWRSLNENFRKHS